MTVRFYDDFGAELTEKTIHLATAEASQSWQKLSANFVAEANMKSLTVQLSTTEAGKDYVWFDAVILRSTAADDFELSFPNGDFSQGFQANGKPVGWGFNANVKSLSLTDWDNNGDQELAIDTSMVSNFWLFTENFPVLAGFPYTASIDIHHEQAVSSQFYIQYYADKEANKQVGTKSVNTDGVGLTEGWNTLSVNLVAPAGALYARILYIGTSEGGMTYLDNAKISFANELVNSSYEYKFTQQDGTPVGCHRVVKAGTVITTDEARTGEQSICSPSGKWWETFYLVATPGDTYEGSFWFKGDANAVADADPNMQLCLYFYDVNGKQLIMKSTNLKPTSDWQQMKIAVDAPMDAYSCI